MPATHRQLAATLHPQLLRWRPDLLARLAVLGVSLPLAEQLLQGGLLGGQEGPVVQRGGRLPAAAAIAGSAGLLLPALRWGRGCCGSAQARGPHGSIPCARKQHPQLIGTCCYWHDAAGRGQASRCPRLSPGGWMHRHGSALSHATAQARVPAPTHPPVPASGGWLPPPHLRATAVPSPWPSGVRRPCGPAAGSG
jgi:hypothetical protein